MNASSKIRSKTAHGDCCSTVKRGTDQYGNGVCIMPRRPTCSETILPRKPIERPAAECRQKSVDIFSFRLLLQKDNDVSHRHDAEMWHDLRPLSNRIRYLCLGIELSDPAEFESLSPTLSGQPTLLGSREWRE